MCKNKAVRFVACAAFALMAFAVLPLSARRAEGGEPCHAATGRELMDGGIVVELSGGCDSAVFEIVDGRGE